MLQGLGDGGVRRPRSARATTRVGRVEAAALHLLGEAQRPVEVEVDRAGDDERAAATGPLQAPLADQVAERAADGDQAAAVARRRARARAAAGRRRCHSPASRARAQVEVDLVVQRDRTQLRSRKRAIAVAVTCLRWTCSEGL